MAESGRPKISAPKIEELSSIIKSGEYDIAKRTLAEFGLNCEDSYGRTALINSVIENKLDFTIWLLDNGASINHQDNTGYTALHFAAQFNLPNITDKLLSKGADPNIQDKHGNIPLWTSIFNSKQEISLTTKLLVKHKSNYDLLNNYGKSPKFMFETFYKVDIEKLELNNI